MARVKYSLRSPSNVVGKATDVQPPQFNQSIGIDESQIIIILGMVNRTYMWMTILRNAGHTGNAMAIKPCELNDLLKRI